MRRLDVVSLVVGLLLTAVALGSLWLAITRSLDWQMIRVIAPFILVGVGVLGLALSRSRD